jgi:hypothetical protein
MPKRMTLRSRIESVAGRKVRLPRTEIRTTAIEPMAIDLKRLVVDQEQAAERDHDRQAAEEDGPAGGGAGDLDGAELVAAGDRAAALGAEPRYHEERVVDGDREADQDHDLDHVLADRGDDLAVDADQAHGADDRAERQDDRHEGGDRRARRDQQDQEGDEQRRQEQPVEASC